MLLLLGHCTANGEDDLFKSLGRNQGGAVAENWKISVWQGAKGENGLDAGITNPKDEKPAAVVRLVGIADPKMPAAPRVVLCYSNTTLALEPGKYEFRGWVKTRDVVNPVRHSGCEVGRGREGSR
jgi:hypothetical protein